MTRKKRVAFAEKKRNAKLRKIDNSRNVTKRNGSPIASTSYDCKIRRMNACNDMEIDTYSIENETETPSNQSETSCEINVADIFETDPASISILTATTSNTHIDEVNDAMIELTETTNELTIEDDVLVDSNRNRMARTNSWTFLNGKGFCYEPQFNYENLTLITIGAPINVCGFCGAKKWKGESANMCCLNGRISFIS